MVEDEKTIEENWDEPIDYPYISSRNIMFRVIEYIDGRYKSPDEDVLKTDFHFLSFQKDDLVVLAARPAIGKTAFVLSLANQLILKKKIPVGFVAPVWSEEDIGMRLLAIETGVSIPKIRHGMLKVDDFRKILECAVQYFEAPFYLFNEPNCSFKAIKRTAINMAMENHIQLLIVDGFEYLQEMIDSEENHYRIKLTYLLSEFKRLAIELHIPVILVMEMPKTKHYYEPTLWDFRRYMIIPDRADKVLFLHRDRLQAYTKSQDAKLIVAKNNCGPTGDIDLEFYPDIVKFSWKQTY